MTSMERIMTTVTFKEPDRIPFFLFPTMHGAKELGLSLKEYFSKGENVAEGQIRLQEKYDHDCYSSFCYASLETEACGGDVLYSDDGPPQAGAPFLSSPKEIISFAPPQINKADNLKKVLKATKILSEKAKGEIPVIGTVLSPFSVPVMQMGFEKYIDLISDDPASLKILLQKNLQFSIDWAKAQISEGANMICYFDPFASVTVTPPPIYRKWGKPLAEEFIRSIGAPVAVHLASGRGLPVLDMISQTGCVAIGVSTSENIKEIKDKSYGKMTIIGNLNGVEMRRWSQRETESIVRKLITDAASGGGFVLSDNHGEIPFQVPDETLMAISESVKKWGQYSK